VSATRFGKYQLLERLAAGGMAEVFRAKTLGAAGFEKDVAIKRILPQLSSDEEFVRMFIDEARLAARLAHRNIVQIFDFDQTDGAYYIAMELIDGCDLRRLAAAEARRGRRLPVGAAVYVAAETLKALAYAHARQLDGRPLGLIHRDVSPHNILISRAGEVKLSDFGIAKAQARASATGSGVIKGKLSYMSPEQARGWPVDQRTDLFSAGIVLWELLAGMRLFDGDSEQEILARVARCQVPSPRAHNDAVPREIETATLRLLAPHARDRFANAGEAVRALGAWSGYRDESDTLAARVEEATLPLGPKGVDTVPPGEVVLDELAQTGSDREARAEAAGNAPESAPSSDAKTQPLQKPHSDPQAPTHTRREVSTGSRSVQPVSISTAETQPAARLRWWALVAVAAVGGGGLVVLAARRHRAQPAAALARAAPRGTRSPAAQGGSPETTASPDPSGPPAGPAPALPAVRATETPPPPSVRAPQAEALPGPSGTERKRPLHPRARASSAAPAPPAVTPGSASPGPTPPASPRSAPTSGRGQLSITVDPWAYVTVDGKPLRQTPIREYPLASGIHLVELAKEERTEQIRVTITAGKLTRIHRDWSGP
jgi:serine/threonine-protein kinase